MTQEPKNPPAGPADPGTSASNLPETSDDGPDDDADDDDSMAELLAKVAHAPDADPPLRTFRTTGSLEVPEVIDDKFHLERMLGEGGMGAVFEATHTVTGKKVALKILQPRVSGRPEVVQRLVREAQAIARIDHPNVVDVFDIGEHENTSFMVMELLKGEPLRDLFAKGPVEPGRLISILMPALQGVSAAHQRGILHRDLKPDNLFVTRNASGDIETTKVLDFGVSKLQMLVEGEKQTTLTEEGTVLGTPQYMSAEQLRGAQDLDQRADVYSFGVILYEGLTGQRPYDDAVHSRLIVEIARARPKPIAQLAPKVPPALAAVAEKAMAAKAEDRFPTVEALIDALRPFEPKASGDRVRWWVLGALVMAITLAALFLK